jgi:hypothetical protein
MALRNLLANVSIAAMAVCALPACKDKAKTQAPDLEKRCETLAKACGEQDKHIDKLVDACKQAAQKQVEKGCSSQVTAVYTCYENELCGSKDRVWALQDLPVLAKRHGKCVAEIEASRECEAK